MLVVCLLGVCGGWGGFPVVGCLLCGAGLVVLLFCGLVLV